MGVLKNLYQEIWEERAHECVNCGIAIPYPVVHNFAHIRSKGAQPALRETKSNINLLCSTVNREDGQPGCHELEHTYPDKKRERAAMKEPLAALDF